MTLSIIDRAGPQGLPAAVIHSGDPMPKTWRIVSTWTHDGEAGAYFAWANASASWRTRTRATWGQLVYRADAPRRDGSRVGAVLGHAANALCCPAIGSDVRLDRKVVEAAEPVRLAYYAQRGRNIRRLDWIARSLYRLNGTPGPDDPFTGTPTPGFDAMPEPSPSDDALLLEAEVLGLAHLLDPIHVHPDNPWPAAWSHVTHRGREWAMAEPAQWLPIRLDANAKPVTDRGLSARFGSRRSKLRQAVWEATQGSTAGSATVLATPATPRQPVAAPPEPGVARARWLGERITQMVGDEDGSLPAHTRRRIAAHRAQSIAAGYGGEEADRDGLSLYGPLSLHLEGLNAYAARVFAGEQMSIGGTDDAVL